MRVPEVGKTRPKTPTCLETFGQRDGSVRRLATAGFFDLIYFFSPWQKIMPPAVVV
jgi:hypothetical protein